MFKMHRGHHGPLSEKEPPFICDYCGIELGDYQTYVDHRQLHINRPKFQCLECDRILSNRAVLRIHMSMHVCSTVFLSTHSLECERTTEFFNCFIFSNLWCSQQRPHICVIYAEIHTTVKEHFETTWNAITMITMRNAISANIKKWQSLIWNVICVNM